MKRKRTGIQKKKFSDKDRLQIIKEELAMFEKIVKPHRKLLEAIGKL